MIISRRNSILKKTAMISCVCAYPYKLRPGKELLIKTFPTPSLIFSSLPGFSPGIALLIGTAPPPLPLHKNLRPYNNQVTINLSLIIGSKADCAISES
jgi:hypothetical protein